jgi:diketogulonate reductase-like aldo/keto reductase
MSADQNSVPRIVLNDGLVVPVIGLGTYRLRGTSGIKTIQDAVETGYTLIDSAFNYENEGIVGYAARHASVPRSKLIIASKLPGRHHRYDEALYTVEESLYRAGLDYYDLYLIHWPNPKDGLYVEAWQAMIEAKKRGYVRSIGVCNFLPEHIDILLKETGVTPSMNQIELYPYFIQEEQRRYHISHNIATECWSPLGRGNAVLTEQCLQDIADTHGKSLVQIILRWHIQLGCIPIPKASSREHLEANLSIFDFELSEQEMHTISALTRPDGRTKGQDPAEYAEY